MLKAIAKKLPKNSTPLSVYQSAWSNAFDHEFDRAFLIADKGLQDFYDPEVTPRLLLLQAMAYEQLGAVPEALATYQTVADRFPATASAAQSVDWLTRSYLRLGRTREAVTHAGALWSAIPKDIKKNYPDAAFWLGEAYAQLDRYEDASQHYTDFLALAKPSSKLLPYAQFQEAMTLARLNQPSAALAQLADFSKSAMEAKNSAWIELAQVQKGNIHFNIREFESAVASYRASTSTPKAKYYEGLALAQMEYFSDAIEAWGKLASAFPQDPYTEQALFRTGRTYFELGKATAAVESFAVYMEKYPDSPKRKEALLQSAHALYNAGLYAQATSFYQSYLSQYRSTDDLVSVTPYLAACAVQTGKTLEETEDLLKGLPPADALASLRWESGAKDYNEKKFESAHDKFGRLLSDFPIDAHAAEAEFFRGESLFLAQRWQDAEGAYTNFLSMSLNQPSPHAPLAQFHKGAALYQQDKLLAAADVFESFLQSYPSDTLVNDAKTNLILCYHNVGQFERRDQMKSKYGEPATTFDRPKETQPESAPSDSDPELAEKKTNKGLYLVEKDKLPFMKQENKENVADSRMEEAPIEQAPQ
jgi:TolA-binding protein